MSDIINRLRALKEASIRNQQYINSIKADNGMAAGYGLLNSGQTISNFSNFFNINTSSMGGPYNYDLNMRLIDDFQARHQDIIDMQQQREQSKQIIGTILSELDDAELDNRLESINVKELQKTDNVKNMIKTVFIKPVADEDSQQRRPRRQRFQQQVDSDGEDIVQDGPNIEDIAPEDHVHIAEYIDKCYKHIIKVLKVYFILADGKHFRLPISADIAKIKTKLEGYIHVPDDDLRKGNLKYGTYLYYLTISNESRVVMRSGYFLKTGTTGILLMNESETDRFEIDFKCPLFRKINNLDIVQVLADLKLNV